MIKIGALEFDSDKDSQEEPKEEGEEMLHGGHKSGKDQLDNDEDGQLKSANKEETSARQSRPQMKLRGGKKPKKGDYKDELFTQGERITASGRDMLEGGD